MTRRRHAHPVAGFTLLELLVVIGIIAILVGLVVSVGVAVTRNAKRNATEGVLAALDRALDEFIVNNNGNIPTFDRADYAGVPGWDGPSGGMNPLSDYLNDPDDPMPQRPDASVFIRQARGVGDVDAILAGIPERFLAVTALPRNVNVNKDLEVNMYDTSPSVLDAWAKDQWRGFIANQSGGGNPVESAWPIREQSLIYYVHPNNRRDRGNGADDKPDAQELFGSTLNGRPYFLSAGPDRFYGHPEEGPAIVQHFGLAPADGESQEDFRNRVLRRARADNVYSYPVEINFRIDESILNELWDTLSSGP